MNKPAHLHRSDIRGYSLLAIQATVGLTGMIENLHHNLLRGAGPLGTPTHEPARGITGLVYRTVRGVTRLVGGSLDSVLAQLEPLAADAGHSSPERDAVVAALNGVLGDHLAAAGNPLAVPMQLRVADGIPVTGRVLVYAHGLCMNPRQLCRNGHDHAATLARDHGWTPVYLHYNSGRHIADNGREFAAQLEQLLAQWPVAIDEIALLGHSMGGLVARSACHYATQSGCRWPARLRRLVCLGSPHQGAPLERGGNWLQEVVSASPWTAAFARLGRIRSAGITDLRHGSLLHEDRAHPDRFALHHDTRRTVPLPAGVACYTLAATLGSGLSAELLPGDGLVPVASALGWHKDPARRVAFPLENQYTIHGIHHMDLLDNAAVYERLRHWLA
jgi:pimeloyl-ACP methyl ester carboxylesterase